MQKIYQRQKVSIHINLRGLCRLVWVDVFCKCISPIPKWEILNPSKLRGLADDNFEIDKMAESSPTARKHYGKRRNCSLRAISPFPTVFSKKTCTVDTQKPWLIWERVNHL